MEWTFLSNYSHVLVCLHQDPDQRVRDIAATVGITERAVQRIIHDLNEAGYIEIAKEGRRNHYKLIAQKKLRHPMEQKVSIGGLLDFLDP